MSHFTSNTTHVISVPRRKLLAGAAGLGALSLGFPGLSLAKPLQGTTLNVSLYSSGFTSVLRPWVREFEEDTGAKVNFDTPGFPVYNQRADLELSTKGSAYDVLNITYIYSSRWINAGWFIPLGEFLDDAARTPADYDRADFLEGAIQAETGKDGQLYGIPWNAEVTLTAASRADLLKEQGIAFPRTTDELLAAAAAVNGKGISGYVTDNHYGWTFPPFLHAFGGDVFRGAPDDLFPTLDTPEAIAAADYFSRLLREFGPDGAVSFDREQAVNSVRDGRTQFITLGNNYLAQLAYAESSKVASTAAWGLIPEGPKGRFPGTSFHAFGIPAGSRNKDAAWQFIVWASSKATQLRAVDAGYVTPTRKSVIGSDALGQKLRVNGYDLGQLAAESFALAAKSGHMKYRTVGPYPQINLQLNKAIELIVSGQRTAEAAMKQAQSASISELRRAGVRF